MQGDLAVIDSMNLECAKLSACALVNGGVCAARLVWPRVIRSIMSNCLVGPTLASRSGTRKKDDDVTGPFQTWWLGVASKWAFTLWERAFRDVQKWPMAVQNWG